MVDTKYFTYTDVGSGSDQVQMGFRSGSDRVISYMKSLTIELGYET